MPLLEITKACQRNISIFHVLYIKSKQVRWIPDIFAFLGHSEPFTFKLTTAREILIKEKKRKSELVGGWVSPCSLQDPVRFMGQFLASINLTFFSHQTWIRYPKKNLNIPSVYWCFWKAYLRSDKKSSSQSTTSNATFSLLIKISTAQRILCSTQKTKKKHALFLCQSWS